MFVDSLSCLNDNEFFNHDNELFVAIHEQILQPIEIQPIEMAEVALRSRQVAAASGSDLCSQVASLDWRRPTQCLWTLCIKR